MLLLCLLLTVEDVNADYSLRYPKLYAPGQLNLLFNKKVFAQSIAEGVISSLVLFFIPYGTCFYALRQDGLDVSDHQSLATVISAALIWVITLRVSRPTDLLEAELTFIHNYLHQQFQLTLSRSALLSYVYSCKASCARQG